MTNWLVKEIQPKLESFKAWLSARGAEVHVPKDDYELIRFKTEKGTSVIYCKKNGETTFYGDAENAWDAFCNDASWRARPPKKRSRNSEINTIRQRDGDLCFVCRKYVEHKDESTEHLVALTHGGPEHISNKYLAHKVCNSRVGHLSAPEKIKIHVDAILLQIEERLKVLHAKIGEIHRKGSDSIRGRDY